MNNQNLIDQLNKIAHVDNSWQDDVLFYEQNQEWLDYSAKIAVLILRVLRQNKDEGKFPSSQKELAEVMNVSPQQINKYVRGTENLKLETIMRISKAIGNQLINVGTVNNIYSQTTKTIVTNIVTDILSSNKFITSSNNGGFVSQIAFEIEEKSQSDSNAVGNVQYAMAA
jgi:plasmid maintenance system antidote protein VapI